MSTYWAVQLGYALVLGAVVLVALRRYERQTEARLARLLDDLDRRARRPLDLGPEAAPGDGPVPEVARRDDELEEKEDAAAKAM